MPGNKVDANSTLHNGTMKQVLGEWRHGQNTRRNASGTLTKDGDIVSIAPKGWNELLDPL